MCQVVNPLSFSMSSVSNSYLRVTPIFTVEETSMYSFCTAIVVRVESIVFSSLNKVVENNGMVAFLRI